MWKFGADMAGRLNFAARPLSIGVPFNFQNMSEDGRLWGTVGPFLRILWHRGAAADVVSRA